MPENARFQDDQRDNSEETRSLRKSDVCEDITGGVKSTASSQPQMPGPQGIGMDPHGTAKSRSSSMELLPKLFWSFFKIGAFTFGGGWAMVPLIRRELVERRKWMANEEFIDALAVAQSAPGPIAINTSVICGYKIAGVAGAVTATAGSSLPSFIIILFVATFVLHFKNSTLIPAVFKGMRPAIFGILAAAVWQVGKTTIKRKRDLAFFAVGAFLLLALNAHPILVVVVAASGGLLYEKFANSRLRGREAGADGISQGKEGATGSCDGRPSKRTDTKETAENGRNMA